MKYKYRFTFYFDNPTIAKWHFDSNDLEEMERIQLGIGEGKNINILRTTISNKRIVMTQITEIPEDEQSNS